MSRELSEVCKFLRTKSINLPSNNEWISSCVECFLEQGNVSLNELQELVYQQWLLADLSDIGVQVIPNDLFRNEKYILQGRYAVQINYLVNVAVSFHKQLQKIRRPGAIANLEVDTDAPTGPPRREESGTRMLKIEMTDGVVTFIGFEDQSIFSLKEPFVPGMKAVLVGPIECRKGVAFLKHQNLICLGGEVDSLHIPNATENILARALKLPENPDPYSLSIKSETDGVVEGNEPECPDDDEEAMLLLAEAIEKKVPEIISSQNTKKNEIHNSTSAHNNKPFVQPTYHSGISQASSKPKVQAEPGYRNPKPVRQGVFSIPETIDLDFDDDFDLLAAESAAAVEVNQAGSSTRSIDSVASEHRAYEMFDLTAAKKDYEEMTNLKQKLQESYSNQPPIQRNSPFSHQPPKFREDGKTVVDYLSDEVSPLITLSPEPEALDDSVDITSDCSYKSDFEPFPPRKRPAIVTAFTKVIKLLKSPKLIHGKWTLIALIEAKGIELEVSFESEVLDKIFTISAAEINSSRQEIASDPVKKQKINQALKESREKFLKLACNMTFNFKDAISDPVIIDVIN